MKHLYIKQNNNVEIVSLDIIEKLYKISQGEGLDSTSDLIGNLQCTRAYDDAVTYLTTKFKNLQINVTDGSYIRFADDAVRQICATNWGDGTGITAAQAAAVSSIGTTFIYNKNIISFEEFKYFTNVTYLKGSNSSANPGAFNGCTSLKKIILPSSITDIQQGSFYNCAITYINLENIKTLGSNCFGHCPLNMELSMPNLTGSFFGFAGTNITKIIDLGKATSIVGSGDIHHTYGAALGSCHYLTEVILPDTMTSITGMIDCTALEKVSFNNNVTIIGDSAFYNCTKLTSIGDVSNVTSIGNSAFSNTNFTSLSFPNVKTLSGNYVNSQFSNCTKLTTITFNSELSELSDSVFNNCQSLKTFDICKITNIPNSAFSGCTSLETIDLTNVTYIGDEAFYNCSSLKNIGSLTNITHIGDYGAFYNCSLLSIDLNLPNLEYIGNGVTFGNSGITSVSDLGTTITELCHTFNGCTKLKTVILNANIISIKDNTFTNCSSMEWIKLLATSVISLPDSYTFANTNNCLFYVPDDLVASYKTATNWSTYASRIFSLTQFAIDFPNG